jgi:hypothetical protein
MDVIEDSALRLMNEIMVELAGIGGRPRPKNPYQFIDLAAHLSDMVREGGKIETARWIWLERPSPNKPSFCVRLFMDRAKPEEVDTERELVVVGLGPSRLR